MYCKYLSKSLNGKIKCRYYKRHISLLSECQNCPDLILKRNKPIKNKTIKQKQIEKARFSNYTDNYNKCYYCGNVGTMDLHEVYGGSNRLRSIRMGFVVPLCRKCHSNEEIINYLRKFIQKEFEKTHTREEFIEITGKSYIKGDDK